VVDLTAALGRASGALGVLQCVAAASWLARHDGPVLATAGDDTADAVSAQIFTHRTDRGGQECR
jgi:3-oxoacyl-[acyl-carrier-protein] synthase II